MKVNGSPIGGEDNTYEYHRRCRMADSIGDYLSDEKVDARQCYEEILSEVDEVIEYHRTYLSKAQKFKPLATISLLKFLKFQITDFLPEC